MDNKSDDQFLVVQDMIDPNRQYSDEKMKLLTEMVEKMMDLIQILSFFTI